MNKEDVIKFLREQTDKDFVEVFYKAVENRKLVEDEEQSYSHCHWVMASVDRLKEENGEWEPYDITFLGVHSTREYPKGWDANAIIHQFGECDNCKNSVISWAKHLICPICDNETYGT